MNELYVNQLQVLVSAEEQTAQLLLDMKEWATDGELKSMFATYQHEAEEQVPRIKALLAANTPETNPIKCKVVAALSAETEDMVADAADATVRDVALITAAQRVKHYEIAVYGAIRAFAVILGKHQNAEVLERNLNEEKDADRVLTRFAERLNAAAGEPA